MKAGWPFSESLLAAAVSHFRWTSLSKKKWTIQGMYVYYIVNTLYHHLSFRNSRHMNVWFIPYTIYQTNPAPVPIRWGHVSASDSPKRQVSSLKYSSRIILLIWPKLFVTIQNCAIVQNYPKLSRIIHDYPEVSIIMIRNTGTALGISWGAPITPEQAKSL